MSYWKNYRIDELATILNSKRIPLNSRERAERKGIYPYYGASAIVDYIDGYLFDGEHVLISEDGENLRSRQTPIAFKANGKFWVNNHAHIVKGKADFINDWLVYYFSLSDLSPYITGAVQPKLNKENLLSIHIPYPGEEDAKKIVRVVRCLDDKIEINRQMNQTLEEMAKTLSEKYFESEASIPLSQFVDINPRLPLKKGDVASYVDMSNLPEKGSSIKTVITRPYNGGAKFQNFDTLLARITPCLENGKTAFVDILEDEEVGWGSTEFIVMRAKETMSPYLVYILARSDSFREFAVRSMVGTSGRQRVQTDMLSSFKIPAISQDIMNSFNFQCEHIFKKIKLNAMEINALTQIRDTLLPKLLSGEIDISTLDAKRVQSSVNVNADLNPLIHEQILS